VSSPYQVHLAQFEGPLDLLLHLIEQAQVDIKDIFISEITSQYLAFMEELEGLDLDTASEFLSMAATLLYIKSRQLLPKPPKEQEEEEDPEVLLIQQLKEYKAFKEAAEQIERLLEKGRGEYYRLPEDIILPQQEISLSGATLRELNEAFLQMLQKNKENSSRAPHPLHQVHQDHFTIRGQSSKIRSLLRKKNELTFEELFEGNAPKLDLIVTFMALLEMINRGEVLLEQRAPFEQIRIRMHRLMDDDSQTDYMDEFED